MSTGPPPRCLRRTDSGIMPHEELTNRSDSLSTESSQSPPEPVGSNHSETSSGIHSNDSADHHLKKEWKQSQQDNNIVQNDGNTPIPTTSNTGTNATTFTEVLVENPPESTVVIRRKSMRPSTSDLPAAILKEDPYGRATNMRMTSFTDNNDLNNIQSSSATLPHYPTQPMPAIYPNCSTMPLPQHTTNAIPSSVMVNGNSCNVYPRQHSTIPTHHNGVKLITNSHNPYIKRLHTKQAEVVKFNNEPIYTKINRASGELYHYTS